MTTHAWSFDRYIADQKNGLLVGMSISETDRLFLQSLKEKVRQRIKQVFSETQKLLQKFDRAGENSTKNTLLKIALKQTSLKYLPDAETEQLVKIFIAMSDTAYNAFIAVPAPRFLTQGSFAYHTINKPYHKPPQEMDLDEGAYLPMAIFEEPAIGHRLLILLVDSSLKSLCIENSGWEFSEKNTCGRISIKSRHIHIDVPMYAIPEKQFELREAALNAKRILKADQGFSFSAYDAILESYDTALDPDSVYLALRNKDKWTKSDPKIVADWFHAAVKRHGENLRGFCRVLKGWRDVKLPEAPLSSITLMKCAVDTLDNHVLQNQDDLTAVLKLIIEQLPAQLRAGVESPDSSDEGVLLFPRPGVSEEDKVGVIAQAEILAQSYTRALYTSTKEIALEKLEELFGCRGQTSDLIVTQLAAPAYKVTASVTPLQSCSDEMQSG